MIVLRNAHSLDLEGIYELAKKSEIGLTTLPKNKSLLKKRINLSKHSFKKNVQKPSNEYYLFVLEDKSNHKIIGTSAILATTGYDMPFYSYHIAKYSRKSPSLNIRNDYEVLTLVNDNQGCSELCTLFLDPEYRHKKNGLLLSKARFLFIAQNKQRFAHELVAELRGYFNEQRQSPFWEHVGRHFFQMTYSEVDQLVLATNNHFIEDLMPQYPIYTSLLHPTAQAVIGRPHDFTVPAMNLLLQEGFEYNNYIHIFDAGPTLRTKINNVQTIKSCKQRIVSGISDEVKSIYYLLTNSSIDFRAVTSRALIHEEDNSCIISKATAKALKVECGETIWISPMNHASSA